MNTEVILGVIAGLMHVVAFVLYYKQTLRKDSNPNGATWSLWFVVSLLNCISFIKMSKNLLVGFLPMASTFSCMVLAGIFFCKDKLSKLDFCDNIALAIGIMSVFVWQYYDSPIYGNLLLQPCIVISFIPTYRGVIKDRDTEKKSLVWFIWSSAYILQIFIVFFKWETWYQLVYPVNCLLLYLGVGMLTLKKSKGGF